MKRVGQVGLIAKALIYLIFGLLILIATYSPAEEPVGLFEVVKYIIALGWYGRVGVLLLTIGILCYSAWKFLQMVGNAEGYEQNLNGYFIRFTWLGPFVFYLLLGGHAFYQLYRWYFGVFLYPDPQPGFQKLLAQPYGDGLVILISLGLMANAVTLAYLGLTGKYRLMISGKDFHSNHPRLAEIVGQFGYFGYGATLFLLSGFFAASIYLHDESLARGQESIFYFFMAAPYGKALLTLIALGSMIYGLYFFLAAFYRWRDDRDKLNSTKTGK